MAKLGTHKEGNEHQAGRGLLFEVGAGAAEHKYAEGLFLLRLFIKHLCFMHLSVCMSDFTTEYMNNERQKSGATKLLH